MDPLATILLLGSAVLHAAWNLRGRRHGTGIAGYAVAELAVALALLPLWPWALGMLAHAPIATLVLIVLSCSCQGLYYLGLSRAYAAGDLGIAYPLIRTLPVLLLAVGGIAASLTLPNAATLIGIALTTAGAGLLGLRPAAGRTGPGQAGAIAVTVVLVAAYTALDARSLPAIRQATGLGPLMTALAVVPIMAAGNGLCALAAALCLPGERARFASLRPSDLVDLALVGLAIWGSYGLALAALALGIPAATAASVRLVSVPLGVLAAAWRLGEPLSARRTVGVAGVVAGVLLLV